MMIIPEKKKLNAIKQLNFLCLGWKSTLGKEEQEEKHINIVWRHPTTFWTPSFFSVLKKSHISEWEKRCFYSQIWYSKAIHVKFDSLKISRYYNLGIDIWLNLAGKFLYTSRENDYNIIIKARGFCGKLKKIALIKTEFWLLLFSLLWYIKNCKSNFPSQQ
jgi:hypothetical protein